MSENEKQPEKTNEPTDGVICDTCGHVASDSAMIVVQPNEDSLCVNCRAGSDPKETE